VSFLPLDLPGRVGLTFAPGKHQTAKAGYRWERDLHEDVIRLVAAYRADLLVCLLEDHELERLGIPGLVSAVEAHRIRVHRHPIPDGGAPPDPRALRPTVELIRHAAAAGETIVIHCAGGLGRTGTVAGCLMRALGSSQDETLAALRGARGPRCPENDLQVRFIAAYPRASSTSGRRSHPPDLASRVAGTVLGAAIGDAMGAPVEFIDSVEEIRRRYGPDGVTGFVELSDDQGRQVARYTDDTQMAEAVLLGLLDARDAGEDDLDSTMNRIADRFIQWKNHPQGGHRYPGRACLAGCTALERGVPWYEAGGKTAGGCGSVMRAYPFGLMFADDLQRAEDWAVAHSRLTHGDPIARAACAAMAVGVACLLNGQVVAGVLTEMVAAAHRQSPRTAAMMKRAIREAREGVGPEVTLDRLRSWAAHEAVSAAVYILVRHPDDPRAAISEGANTPGDSDSIATLAGALLGARVGIRAFPREWDLDVERGGELRALAGRSGRLQGPSI
jgi:ADP-ribosylglycohydrolase